MPLPTPIGRQKEVLYYPPAGHVVVLGSAGSGKTTLAVLRAAHLATVPGNPGRVLLVTFNKMLSTFLRDAAPASVGAVDVRNYHHFARGYLSRRGRLPAAGAILDPEPRLAIVRQVRAALLAEQAGGRAGARVLAHPAETLDEEFAWISRMGIRSADAYADAERVQRGGFRVVGPERAVVWEAYDRYRAARRNLGRLHDWDDLAGAVADEFANDTSPRFYQHVVIDEGQDFSPEMLRSLVRAVPATNGTVTFFGDTAQQIYGSRISWRDAGLQVREVVRFEENYRNTAQIADLALALARGPHFRGVPDLVAPRRPKAEGLLPTLVTCADAGAERRFAVRQVAATARAQSVAVLLRDRGAEGAYLQAIREAGVPVTRLHGTTPRWRPGPGAWVGTYHAAKGLEFDAVVLPHVGTDVLPNPARAVAIGDAAASLAEEARLLYVAITRARAQLVLTHHGALTPLLTPVPAAHFTFVTDAPGP